VLFLILLVMIALLTVAWGLGRTPSPRDGLPLGPPQIAEPSATRDAT
jgi:hypothetical protein